MACHRILPSLYLSLNWTTGQQLEMSGGNIFSHQEHHRRRQCRRLRQWQQLSIGIAVLVLSIIASMPSSSAAESSINSFAPSLIIEGEDAANKNSAVNNANSFTKKQPPPNFLRWRSVQQLVAAMDDENKTNEDWNITSNDYKNDTGVFVTFPSFGLQIGPMVNSFLSSSSSSSSSNSRVSSSFAERSSNKNIDSSNELITAVHVQQSMLGLHYAIESYINETFRRTSGRVVNDTNYTLGKFAFGNIRGDVKIVSECQYVASDDNGEVGGDEPVRNLEQTQQQQQISYTNITVYIPGGSAFYVFGVGGWWMENIPTSMELYNLIIDSVNGKDGGVMGGGGLASWIKNMAVNGSESMMMASENFGDQEGTTTTDGDLTMFQSVQGVKVIEGLTLAPTASPAPNPDSSFEDETSMSGTTDDNALVEDTEDNGEYGDTIEGSDVTDNISNSIVIGGTSSNVDSRDDASSSNMVIIAGALSCLLVFSAVIGLFIYRKRQRNDDSIGRIDGDGTKIVPMSMMSDENDGLYQGYSDAYNSLFSAAGGGADRAAVVDDVEAGCAKKSSSKDRVAKNVEFTSKEDMGNKKPLFNITKVIGVSADTVESVTAGKEGESSQQDDSLVPQVGGATIAETRLRSLGFEANNSTPSGDIENDIVSGSGDTKQERPPGRQDNLQQKYRVNKAATPSYDPSNFSRSGNSDGGGAIDSVGKRIVMDEDMKRSSKSDVDAPVVTFHNIEKAENIPRVKRVTFADAIVENDVQAHDILDDINAAVKRQSSLSNDIDSTPLLSLSIGAGMSSMENDDRNDNPSNEVQENHKEVKEAENVNCGILNAIGEVARRTRTADEDAYIPRNDPPGDEVFVTSKKDDPPGDDLFVSQDDDTTLETDIFSGLRTIHDDDGTSSTYGVTPMGCGSNIIQQTKEFFLCKQVRIRGQQHQASLYMKNKSSDCNYPFSTDSNNPKAHDSSNTPPIVSDDEYDSEIDLEEEDSSSAMIQRPWKDRWNTDPSLNQTSSQRVMLCSTPESSGSNYDPDSDWDVSDTEVDFVVVDEDKIFATRNLRSNNNKTIE